MQNPLHKHKFPAVALGFFGLLEKLVILLSQLHDYPESGIQVSEWCQV